ncbi:hypothetical protein PseBG33_5315 [Pseudomonas synxantha BG33R]|nr:hypothetical protein PseBG33_5315 [Pseudomonas synxantha BG33R]
MAVGVEHWIGGGSLKRLTHTEIDKNGVVDQADKELIRSLRSSFLAFKW